VGCSSAWGLLGVATRGAAAQSLPDSLASHDSSELAQTNAPTPDDPWEGFNRRAFKLNRGFDRFLIGPMGRGYMKVTPRVVRARVSSFVANLSEPRTAINDLAQGRPRAAGVTASRFLINSTVGGLGLFDVGGKIGLEAMRPISVRPWAVTARGRAAISCCRLWAPPPCGTPPADLSTR
jgi:phospholipid-binding lipoprotein MlaA